MKNNCSVLRINLQFGWGYPGLKKRFLAGFNIDFSLVKYKCCFAARWA